MRLKIALAVVLMLACTACTTTPPLDFTLPEVGRVASRKDAEMLSLTVGFAPKSQQRTMRTNETLPPIWKEGLQDAIARSLIFTDGASKKVNVSVRIVEVNTPSAGTEFRTKIAALYEVVDRQSGDIILSQEVQSEGSVPFNYAFAGIVRAREAVNRAIRNNIAAFIVLLEKTDFSRPQFPAKP